MVSRRACGMTEEQWLACDDPAVMLEYLKELRQASRQEAASDVLCLLPFRFAVLQGKARRSQIAGKSVSRRALVTTGDTQCLPFPTSKVLAGLDRVMEDIHSLVQRPRV